MNLATGNSPGPPRETRRPGRWWALAAWTPTPLEIALVYAVFGFGALYVSDVLFVRWFEGTPLLRQIQALKGGIEVVVTAGLLFVLARQSRIRLESRNRQLDRTREQLDVLHRVLRHNLRNDINVIMGATTAVREACDSPTAAEQCERIHSTSEGIAHYVDQAKKINSLTEGQQTRTETDANAVVERVLETHPALLREGVRVSTDVEDVPPVVANVRFEDALGEIVDNAVTHSDHDRPHVGVSVERSDDRSGYVTVRIADDGPGIPEEERRVLDRRTERPLTHSRGMGLWFASWTALVAGGGFEIADNDPRGTVVTFFLPIARTRDLVAWLPLPDGPLGARA